MVLVCTRRFRFLNFTIFFYLFYFHFIFSLLFIYPRHLPTPIPTTSTHDIQLHSSNFRFYWQKVSFRQFAWGEFHAHSLASLTLISMKKNYSANTSRKNIPFYPARTGINFPYFQLATLRSFRFPSLQLISQCNFSQLALKLYGERVNCRAAPLSSPDSV